ncbi:hypothetical protein EI94DRAFT_1701980 [Lactarius quietus]|nr:hypothetical protein EI94DRAFT_1701980 [Lactarius quietus]
MIWDQSDNHEGFCNDPLSLGIIIKVLDANTLSIEDIEDMGSITAQTMEGTERNAPTNWHPTPHIYSDCPGHTVMHGALGVAEIYEELNNLHEETVAIVLAQNKEVKRQLSVLKKELSETHNNLAGLTILVFFYVIFLLIIFTILH